MEKRRSFLDAIFPAQYDFHMMLQDQADETVRGVEEFVRWLEEGKLKDPTYLRFIEGRVDDMRHAMEDKLMAAFTTPFDRQDIYSISRQMDYLLNQSLSTAEEMHAFGVTPDEHLRAMAKTLLEGTRAVADGIRKLSDKNAALEPMIAKMRQSERRIEELYILSMAELFERADPREALKRREVYHHLKDAGTTLRATVDTLHRIVVGMA